MNINSRQILKKKKKKKERKKRKIKRKKKIVTGPFFPPKVEKISKIFIHYNVMYMHMIDNFSIFFYFFFFILEANISYSLLCSCYPLV